jgi:TPR repeat protein
MGSAVQWRRPLWVRRVDSMLRVAGLVMAFAVLAGPLGVAEARPVSQEGHGAADYVAAEAALAGGQVEAGLKALEKAASQNGLRAQVRLGTIYREGRLVQQDEAKACQLFSEAAGSHARLDPRHPAAPLVGEAFRNLAMCYARDATGPRAEQNAARAAELFYQAGVIFGDAQGLYELALMYLTGEGITRNPALAVFHLYSAARKRYPPAQAQLGVLLWEGKVIKRKPGPGLALLMLAREGASAEDRAWIRSCYDDAMITASPEEEAEALRVANELRNTYGTERTNALPVASDESVPLPHRSPLRRSPFGTSHPLVVEKGMEKKNTYGGQPTGINAPADSVPQQP